MTTDKRIEPLAVSSRDILYIREVLQSPLDLKRCGPGFYQFLQMIDAVHVFQREQVAVVNHFPTLCILERELHTAELRTFATIGAATETILRGITLSGVTHTEGTVDKHLELDIGHLTVDLPDFVQGELTGQHHT